MVYIFGEFTRNDWANNLPKVSRTAVGSQARVCTTDRWPTVPLLLYTRVGLQVVYPILLVILCCRTFLVRVMPDALIMFEPSVEAEDSAGDGAPTFLSRIRTSLKENHSLFAWANRGAWQTVETDDEETRREGDQFRIGFEPLFVDFEKSTAWFMVYSLLEVRNALIANWIWFWVILLPV